ncbi:hypothetical protein GGR57DRAFT_102140 [Xylariaceae sp. FL1272]|nr:hypothetical protein GGR57DRAFT_102140 [Xylariaceae sp. FL1272]
MPKRRLESRRLRRRSRENGLAILLAKLKCSGEQDGCVRCASRKLKCNYPSPPADAAVHVRGALGGGPHRQEAASGAQADFCWPDDSIELTAQALTQPGMHVPTIFVNSYSEPTNPGEGDHLASFAPNEDSDWVSTLVNIAEGYMQPAEPSSQAQRPCN